MRRLISEERRRRAAGLRWIGVITAMLAAFAIPSARAETATASAAETAAAAPATTVEACPPAFQPPTPEQAAVMAVQNSRDRGVLYRLTRNGHVSYLYGTVHVGKFEWLFPGPGLLTALTSTDTLAVELDVSDPAIVAATRDGMASLGPKELTPELQTRLNAAVGNSCFDPAVVQALRSVSPLLRMLTVSISAATRDGIRAEFGQDGRLMMLAKQLNKPIVSLESVETQLAVFGGLPAEQMLAMFESTLRQLEDGNGRRTLVRLADAWRRGDLVAIENYRDWCECDIGPEVDEFLKRANDDRNVGIADAVARLHDGGKRVLAAVGAMHMTGEQALPQLLEARGFTVERIPHQPVAGG